MEEASLSRVVMLCLALAAAETVHGMIRIAFVAPRLGEARAIKLAGVTGTLLAFALCWVFVPGVGLGTAAAHLGLGCVLAAFMAGFDIAIGRWLARRPWPHIWRDFDPRTGNRLAYGLAALTVIPLVVWSVQGGSAR